MNIISTGVIRYRVLGLRQSKPFIVARIETVNDDLEPGDDLNRIFDDIVDMCRKFLEAAQALDEPNAPVNQDLPDEPEGYIHRIGRTARMGREGHAISLVTPEERVSLGRIERTLGITLEREMVEGFEQPEITASKPVKLFSSGFSARASRNRTRMKWA